MTELTTDIGEEFLIDTLPDGTTITFLLYDDTNDAIGETDDLAAIGSEPSGAAYARQSSTVTTSQLTGSGNGDYGFSTDTDVSFDLSDSTDNDANTGVVNHVGFIANFDSSVAGDGGTATDHLIGVDQLSQEYSLADFDSVSFNAGNLEHKVD